MANKMQRAFEEKAFGKPTIVPTFFDHAAIDQRLTTGYGINMYKSSTYVRIKTVGRKDNTVRKATEDDVALFSEHYKKYLEGTDSDSISMESVAGFSTANQFTLRDIGVTSFEELATYQGELPTAELKLMRHCAEYLMGCMQAYEPPTFYDEDIKVHETVQTQRQVLQASQDEPAYRGSGSDFQGGVRQVGVSLDENGNIIELNGRKIGEEGVQEESQQEESRQKTVINFY